jgi:hypothetical protein
MCHSRRAQWARSAGWVCSVGRVTTRWAVSRVVLPPMVRVRVMRIAWAAWGKPRPSGVSTVTALTGAGIPPAVAAVAAAVPDADLRPRQRLEPVQHSGLVTLDPDHQMRASTTPVAVS